MVRAFRLQEIIDSELRILWRSNRDREVQRILHAPRALGGTESPVDGYAQVQFFSNVEFFFHKNFPHLLFCDLAWHQTAS
jgi:hypothetical protein